VCAVCTALADYEKKKYLLSWPAGLTLQSTRNTRQFSVMYFLPLSERWLSRTFNERELISSE
jgi:hypothetical protein